MTADEFRVLIGYAHDLSQYRADLVSYPEQIQVICSRVLVGYTLELSTLPRRPRPPRDPLTLPIAPSTSSTSSTPSTKETVPATRAFAIACDAVLRGGAVMIVISGLRGTCTESVGDAQRSISIPIDECLMAITCDEPPTLMWTCCMSTMVQPTGHIPYRS